MSGGGEEGVCTMTDTISHALPYGCETAIRMRFFTQCSMDTFQLHKDKYETIYTINNDKYLKQLCSQSTSSVLLPKQVS